MPFTNLSEPFNAVVNSLRILIVDDDLPTRTLIGTVLRAAGFCALEFADGGGNALTMIKHSPPDLVLLDMIMPQMDGHDLCLAVRGTLQLTDLPILAMTGPDDAHEWARVLTAGATDLISKPIHLPELVARICIHLKNRALLGEFNRFREHTARELTLARDMQKGLLPTSAILDLTEERYGVAIASIVKPCDALGGDSWYTLQLSPSEFGLLVFDVAGHGTIAAINAFRLHTLLTQPRYISPSPGGTLSWLNDCLAGILLPGQFVTAFCAKINIVTETLTYAAAGSPNPIILKTDGTHLVLDTAGVPLGIAGGLIYQDHSIPFSVGDKMMIASDALAEAPMARGDGILGEEAAEIVLIEAMRQLSPADAVAFVCDHLDRNCGSNLPDDLTVIAIEQLRNPSLVDVSEEDDEVKSRRRCVLVVEGDPFLAEIAQRSAGACGMEADVVRDLRHAAPYLRSQSYDAVVLDMDQDVSGDGLRFPPVFQGDVRPALVLLGDARARVPDAIVGWAEALELRIAAVLRRPLRGEALRRVLSSIPAGGRAESGARTSQIRCYDLAAGIDAGEVMPIFQPEVQLSTGRAVGFEALARWVSPKFGTVPPSLFLPLADAPEVARKLANLVLEGALNACAQARRGNSDITVSVNFSAVMLRDEGMLCWVLGMLEEHDLPAGALVMEVSEADLIGCHQVLSEMRRNGVRVAIDDFGIGAGSLATLAQIEPDRIKIDATLVRRLPTDDSARRMLRILVASCAAMGVEILAKSVETAEMRDLLLSLGCARGMGWFYGRAMTTQTLRGWLEPNR